MREDVEKGRARRPAFPCLTREVNSSTHFRKIPKTFFRPFDPLRKGRFVIASEPSHSSLRRISKLVVGIPTSLPTKTPAPPTSRCRWCREERLSEAIICPCRKSTSLCNPHRFHHLVGVRTCPTANACRRRADRLPPPPQWPFSRAALRCQDPSPKAGFRISSGRPSAATSPLSL